MTTPRTEAEWRRLATFAAVLLRIESARAYGLITGGPTVNEARCAECLAEAQQRGIVPTEAEIDASISVVVGAFGVDGIVIEKGP